MRGHASLPEVCARIACDSRAETCLATKTEVDQAGLPQATAICGGPRKEATEIMTYPA